MAVGIRHLPRPEQLAYHRVTGKRYRDKLRREALEAYGGCCACCGEEAEAFLVIDHIGGGGGHHRRALGTGSHKVYLWLKRNGYPEGFRVLCCNCNQAIHFRGECPHEMARRLQESGNWP